MGTHHQPFLFLGEQGKVAPYHHFCLSLEPLAEALHRSSDYQGVCIGSETHKLSMFADDMALYVQSPESSLKAIEQILSQFQRVFGLNVNVEKSLIYSISLDEMTSRNLKDTFSYAWVREEWRYLGVQIPLNFDHFS